MAYTYYTRLTLVHPQASPLLDPRMGVVIAETATTGRFILSDISWLSAVSPNSLTTVAFMQTGNLKIVEPLGMSLFDYIRAAAFEVGMENHMDACFLLEIEVLAEDYLTKNENTVDSPYKYIWPIFFVTSKVKSSFSERGTEYDIEFAHIGGYAQTDLVQPIKETTTIEKVKNLKEYFEGLQQKLEEREFKYAAARQKAGSRVVPGGKNPASKDDYHDEYHFILEPRLEDPGYELTTKGPADKGVQGSWSNYLPWTTNSWNVTARPGTTIMQQITNVMMSTKKISDLLPGRPKPATADASGSSDRSTKNMKDMLGTVYQFFRVETYTVYKLYDYVRGRYAVKHVFLIYLADQPNMFQYPDEIDLLNSLSNKDQVELKLKYYIQEGLLEKIYYHNYTGLNTDVLKVDLQFNQTYSLPTFTQVWADYGSTGPGMMNIQNYNRRTSPFVHRDDKGARTAISDLKAAKAKNQQALTDMQDKNGKLKDVESTGAQKLQRRRDYEALQQKIKDIDDQLRKREQELATMSIPTTQANAINSRSQLLKDLKGNYAEDMDFIAKLKDALAIDFPSLRARNEISAIDESIETTRSENERLMEKIFAVQLSPRDLMELELEIIADPYWLGVPNVILQGKTNLDKIKFPKKTSAAIKSKLNEVMPKIDPTWNNKTPVWGNYGVAQKYTGSSLIYFNTQVPDGKFNEKDMLTFNSNDQIVGIYMVQFVTNEFKNGIWTQKLKTVRDPTIPSHVLPRGLTGEMVFEKYMDDVIESPVRAVDKLNELKEEREKERAREKGTNNMAPVPGTEPPKKTILNDKMSDALARQKELLAANPAPTVNNPVEAAKELVVSGKSKQEAYAIAKQQYIDQVNANAAHMEKINKQAYADANIKDFQPYDAKTISSLALTRSDNGGLEAWKFSSSIGSATNKIDTAAKSNNPAGIGYDSESNRYYRYSNFEDGMAAANEYYNYGNGVKQVGSQGSDRLLLPTNVKADQQLEYIKNKLKVKGGK